MRTLFATSWLIAACVASTAFAQTTDRGPATQSFVNACVASPHLAGRSTPEPTCACAAGVLSGQMTDRQYYVVGRLTPFTGNDPAMQAEIQRLIGEGFTGEEIVVVGNMMVTSENLINSTCRVIDR